MPKAKNISTGPRGAWQGLTLVMADPGEVIEAEDFEPEWFEVVEKAERPEPAKPEPAKVKARPAPAKAGSSAKD